MSTFRERVGAHEQERARQAREVPELTDQELLSADPETLTAVQIHRLEEILGDPEYAS